uniref:Uncharacterized protein n=1 Tax=Tanacetum cinerariifolium TaxID=118510 RepID=A0A699GQ41_TANCI|nr:hypothetical protein [Tanacetum cinerariifolium]
MMVPHQVNDDVPDNVDDDVVDVPAADPEPTLPSPTPVITPPPPQQEITSTPPLSPHQYPQQQPSSPPQQQQPSPPSQTTNISMDLLNTLLETCTTLTRRVENLKQDKIAQALEITKLKQRVRRLEKKNKLKDSGLKRLRKAEPAKLNEVIEVVTTAKLMTKLAIVVATAASTITAAPMPMASAARRRKGVVIRDPKETATPSITVYSELKSKDKGKGILVEEPKPLKKKAQIEQDEANSRELEAELNENINWGDVIEHVKRKEKPIFEKHFNSNVDFLEKGEEQLEEEASKALKRKSESSEQQAAKKQKLDEEVPIVDYEIHTEHSKPYYKIIRADRTHQLFLSFISLLKNFDREDLEMLWQIIQERFASLKPKNFTDDFLLNALKTMFKKPDVEAQMILLVEKRYLLTRFTLDQMLNNVRLQVKEESEVSLELLRFVRRKQQEGYRPKGLSHLARNYTVRPRINDAAYLQTQLLIDQKEETGIELQAEEFDLMAAVRDLDEIKEVNANYILMANLQQASTLGTLTNKAPVYDLDGSAEIHEYENCSNNEIFNMFTQEEQYTELLEPIFEPKYNKIINVGSQNELSVVPRIANQHENENVVAAWAEGNSNRINGNLIRCYNCQGEGYYASNSTVKPRKKNAAYLQTQLQIAQKEKVGIKLNSEEFDFMAAAGAYDEIDEVNAKCTLKDNLQQALTSGTHTDSDPIYDSDGSVEVNYSENCYDNDIFNMFTQKEQYTELLEPIPKPHQVQQNVCNVIYEVLLWNKVKEQ